MAQPEGLLVNKIRKEISAKYPEAWHVKVAGGLYQTPGLPDLLVCVRGQLFGLEVKKQRARETEEQARGRATALQIVTMEEMAKAGAVTAVVLSADEVLKIISEHFGK